MSKRPGSYSIEEPDSKRNKTECNDDRLLIRSSPILLKEMAAVKVCLELWYHQNIRQLKRLPRDDDEDEDDDEEEDYDDEEDSYYDNDYYEDYDNWVDARLERREERRQHRANETFSLRSLQVDVKSSLFQLSLPSPVEYMIAKYLSPIQDEMVDWISYQKRRIFFHINEKFLYNYLDEIVWNSDGTVHYELTARSMLSSPRLSDIEKYRLMCTYCLEDDIEATRPDVFGNRYIERWSLGEQPLLCYWNYKKRGKLPQLLTAGAGSVENRMMTLADNEHAILYFFNRLTDDEKIHRAKELILNRGRKYQNILINNMNDVQQHHIFMEIAADIITTYGMIIITENYTLNSDVVECALHVWMHVRNFVSESGFVQLFCTILSKLRAILVSKDLTYFMAFEFLANIWKNAPNALKQFALDYEGMKIIDLLLYLTHTRQGNNFELLTVILSDASADYKANVIQSDSCRKLCEWMIQHSRPTLLDQFIKVCLPNEDGARTFKSILFDTKAVREHCAQLCCREINKLDELLTFFLSDSDAVADFKARILTFPGGIRTYKINLNMDEIWSGKSFDGKEDIKHRKFLFDMLFKATSAVRRYVINSSSGNEFCEFLMKFSRPSLLNYMVQLCLPDDEAIAFKTQLLERPAIKKMFLERYENGDWNAVNELLFSYVPNADANAEYKARLLMDDSMIVVCSRKFAAGVKEGCGFIQELLSKASPNTKKAVISLPSTGRLMKIMIKESQLDILVDFVRLCIPNDEIVEFKKQLITTKFAETQFLFLFEAGKLVRLNDLLTKFLPGNDILNFKSKVMTSIIGIQTCLQNFHPTTYRTLIANIEAVFSNAIVATTAKLNIFLSSYAIEKYHEWFKKGCYTEFINFIGYLCSDQRDVKTIKEKLLNFYRKKSMVEIFSEFDVNQFQQVILWCVDSGENLILFKRSLPLKNIFNQMLQDSVFIRYASRLPQCRFRNSTSFQELDRFLRWYFVTTEEVKKFKINEIHGYSKIEMVCTLIRKKDESYLRKVMLWFLDNDPVQIQTFKTAFSRSKISNIF